MSRGAIGKNFSPGTCRISTLTPRQQLTKYVAPVWEAIVDTAVDLEAGLARVLHQIRPDLIVLDNVIMFPAIARYGCPWVRVVSCAETELRDDQVPPYLSGLDLQDGDFGKRFHPRIRLPSARPTAVTTAFAPERASPKLPPGEFWSHSPDLNLLLAPVNRAV